MAEYLDKEAFKKSVEERYCKPCKAEKKDHNGCWCRACWVDDMLDEVECFQPADVTPVRHGIWISLTDCSNAGVYCSVCHKKVYKEDYAICNRKNKLRSDYCPNCGAKMQEVE
ncbi:MAG: hypothetical protein PUH11_03670 [Bacilli bacterium]|nr:hypothetical protein [Bacilli bacterium]